MRIRVRSAPLNQILIFRCDMFAVLSNCPSLSMLHDSVVQFYVIGSVVTCLGVIDCSGMFLLRRCLFNYLFVEICLVYMLIHRVHSFHEQSNDLSLNDYIGAQPGKHATFLPHTAGRYSAKRCRKAQCPIVERLTNSLMMHGRNNGKKLMAVRIVKHAMEIIHLLTDQNPIQVIVDAIVNRYALDAYTQSVLLIDLPFMFLGIVVILQWTS